MTSESHVMHKHKSPAARQHTRDGSTALGVNGLPISASTPYSPKAFNNSLMNGDLALFSSTATFPSSNRFASEPPCDSISAQSLTTSSNLSKDDAYPTAGYQGRRKKASQAASKAYTPIKSFDPRQLLNPKSFDTEKRRRDEETDATPSHEHKTGDASTSSPDFVFASVDAEDTTATSSEPEGSGMGNLIERVHNVEKREDRPQKKRKTEHLEEAVEENKPKASFAGGGKGGEIGEYMRQKRKEAHDEAGSTSTVVDLTAGGLLSVGPWEVIADRTP